MTTEREGQAAKLLRTPLRVGIMGASCTGKTTLAAALAEALGLTVAIEGAREAAGSVGIGDANDVCPTNALEFQRLVFEIKVRAEQDLHPTYVSDRTVIDCAAFWLYRELKGILRVPQSERHAYFGAIEAYLERQPYHILFFLEHDAFPWKGDGFRIEDQEPMAALLLGVAGGRFRTVLASTSTEVLIVSRETRDIESRLAFCIERIRKVCSPGM